MAHLGKAIDLDEVRLVGLDGSLKKSTSSSSLIYSCIEGVSSLNYSSIGGLLEETTCIEEHFAGLEMEKSSISF
jgi:hypothetical protein